MGNTTASDTKARRRVFFEVLGALAIALAFFQGGMRFEERTASLSRVVEPAADPEIEPIVDFFRAYLNPADTEDYVEKYADFVKPYYSWPGGATREQIRAEHERYLRAYDLSDLDLIEVLPKSASNSYSSGIHKFTVVCRRYRKHKNDDKIERAVVELEATVDCNARPPRVVGVRTLGS